MSDSSMYRSALTLAYMMRTVGAADEAAVIQLYERYYEPLVSFLRQYTKDRGEAKVIAHDTLSIAIQRLRGGGMIDDHRKLAEFLMETGKGVLEDSLRRKGQNLERAYYIGKRFPIEHLGSGVQVGRSTLNERAVAYLRNLSEQDREVVFRVIADEESIAGVASEVGLPADYASKVLAEVKNHVRELVSATPTDLLGDEDIGPSQFYSDPAEAELAGLLRLLSQRVAELHAVSERTVSRSRLARRHVEDMLAELRASTS